PAALPVPVVLLLPAAPGWPGERVVDAVPAAPGRGVLPVAAAAPPGSGERVGPGEAAVPAEPGEAWSGRVAVLVGRAWPGRAGWWEAGCGCTATWPSPSIVRVRFAEQSAHNQKCSTLWPFLPPLCAAPSLLRSTWKRRPSRK